MRKKFKASVRLDGTGLGWRVIDIPFSVEKEFGSKARVPVTGTVNGFAFRTSLFPFGNGQHIMMLNKQMQKGAGVTGIGDIVQVELEIDTEKRTVTTPDLLKKELSEDKSLLKYFNALNYSTRKWMIDWITQPKSKEAQVRRTEQLAVRLMEMRDGEEVAPPILQAEFARNPKAKLGWELLTPSLKRGHLFGIFSYNNPETRAKRVQKAIDMMVEYAEKNQAKKNGHTKNTEQARKKDQDKKKKTAAK